MVVKSRKGKGPECGGVGLWCGKGWRNWVRGVMLNGEGGLWDVFYGGREHFLKSNFLLAEVTQYVYNTENQLVEVKVQNQSIARYRYDGLGRRIEKSTGAVANPTVTRYVYDAEDILGMVDGSGGLKARFTHGPGFDEPLVARQDSGDWFFHADGT